MASRQRDGDYSNERRLTIVPVKVSWDICIAQMDSVDDRSRINVENSTGNPSTRIITIVTQIENVTV